MPTRTSPSGRKRRLELRAEKVRTGFGQWAAVYVVRCNDGHKTRLLKRRGTSFGPGAMACAHCGHAARLNTASPNLVWRVKR